MHGRRSCRVLAAAINFQAQWLQRYTILAAAAWPCRRCMYSLLGTVTVLRLIDPNRKLQPERREATCACLCAPAEAPSAAYCALPVQMHCGDHMLAPPPTGTILTVCVRVRLMQRVQWRGQRQLHTLRHSCWVSSQPWQWQQKQPCWHPDHQHHLGSSLPGDGRPSLGQSSACKQSPQHNLPGFRRCLAHCMVPQAGT